MVAKQPPTFPAVFGGVLALILLLLYAVTGVGMIIAVLQVGAAGKVQFTDGVTLVVTTIGGLVSALVIAKLAATAPGQTPSMAITLRGANPTDGRINHLLALLYLGVWLGVGLGAFVVGVIQCPDANQTLHDIGATWLGVAVTAGYAYFGIEPKA